MEGWLNAKPYKSRGIKKLNRLMEGKPEHKQKPQEDNEYEHKETISRVASQ